jgi:hypothetical protein
MHVVFVIFLFFSLYVHCEDVSQRITELSRDYMLTGRLTSWHIAGKCGSMDIGLSVFAFMFLDTSFDSSGGLARGC